MHFLRSAFVLGLAVLGKAHIETFFWWFHDYPDNTPGDWCSHQHRVPYCAYYHTETTPHLRFFVNPDATVSINGSTTTWGAHKALEFDAWVMQAEWPAPNIEVRMMFKEPPLKRGWGIPLLEMYLNRTGMKGHPAVQPHALLDFINSFEPGQENHGRVQSWLGQRQAPRKEEAIRPPLGGSEFIVPTGLIVDMPADGKIRIEIDATLETWGPEGTVVQCIGACTDSSVQWSKKMGDGDIKHFPVGQGTEFLEINFINAMRIVLQTERDYVLYLPRDQPLVAENRLFLVNEKIHTDTRGKLPRLPMEGGVRVCEKGRGYEGQPSERNKKYCQTPSILRFREWELQADGPVLERLPPRPLTTVSDFVEEFFNFQAARYEKVERA